MAAFLCAGRFDGYIHNEVSCTHGPSVIAPERKRGHHTEWEDAQNGKATMRGLVCQDIDAATTGAFTCASFWEQLTGTERASFQQFKSGRIKGAVRHRVGPLQ